MLVWDRIDIKEFNVVLSELINNIKNCKEKIKEIEKEISKVKFVNKKITDIFDIKLGKAEYTKKYINNNNY